MFVVNLLVAARKALSERRHRDQVYAELMGLDDHSLSDIGIHRSQIPGIVEGLREDRREAKASNPALSDARLAGGHR